MVKLSNEDNKGDVLLLLSLTFVVSHLFPGFLELTFKKLLKLHTDVNINNLTATYKYSRSKRESLPLPIPMKLSEKPKFVAKFL